MKLFKYCFDNNIKLEDKTWNLFFTRLFHLYGQNIPATPEVALLKTVEDITINFENDHQKGKKDLNEYLEKDLDILIGENYKLSSKPGGIILLNTLFGLNGKDKILEKKIVESLKNFFSQRELLKSEASKIEIIVGSKEYQILCEFDMNSTNRVMSPDAIEKQINKVLNDDYYLFKNYKIDIVTLLVLITNLMQLHRLPINKE